MGGGGRLWEAAGRAGKGVGTFRDGREGRDEHEMDGTGVGELREGVGASKDGRMGGEERGRGGGGRGSVQRWRARAG